MSNKENEIMKDLEQKRAELVDALSRLTKQVKTAKEINYSIAVDMERDATGIRQFSFQVKLLIPKGTK